MGLIDNIRQKGAEGRLTEEVLYAEVLREMQAGIRRDGLWAKALSEAGGAEAVAKAGYIKLRVQSLRDEVAIALSEHKKLMAQEAESRRQADQAALAHHGKMKAQAEEQARWEKDWEERQRRTREWDRKSSFEKRMTHWVQAMWLGGAAVCLGFVSFWIGSGSSGFASGLTAFFFGLVAFLLLLASIGSLIDSFKREPPQAWW